MLTKPKVVFDVNPHMRAKQILITYCDGQAVGRAGGRAALEGRCLRCILYLLKIHVKTQ